MNKLLKKTTCRHGTPSRCGRLNNVFWKVYLKLSDYVITFKSSS